MPHVPIVYVNQKNAMHERANRQAKKIMNDCRICYNPLRLVQGVNEPGGHLLDDALVRQASGNTVQRRGITRGGVTPLQLDAIHRGLEILQKLIRSLHGRPGTGDMQRGRTLQSIQVPAEELISSASS